MFKIKPGGTCGRKKFYREGGKREKRKGEREKRKGVSKGREER